MEDVIDIAVTPLCAACGAEIKGIDLTKPLSDETVRAIKDAWAKHLVLVFRGQSLSEDDQLRFVSYFGPLGERRKAPEQLRGRGECPDGRPEPRPSGLGCRSLREPSRTGRRGRVGRGGTP